MGILSEIEKVRGQTFITSLLGLLLLFSPGALTVFYFQEDLFLTLDFLKLLLLSVTYISPLLIINLLILLYALETTRRKNDTGKEDWYVGFMTSLLITGLLFYIAFAWTFFTESPITFMVNKVGILEIIFIIIMLAGSSFEKRKTHFSSPPR